MRIDCHNDTALLLREHPSLAQLDDAHLDYARLRKYLDAAIFAIFVHEQDYAGLEAEEFRNILALLQADLAQQPDLQLLLWRDQLETLPAAQITQIMISMEGATPLGKDAAHFQEYFDQGLRAIGFTWNYDNDYGCCAFSKGGLRAAGLDLVQRCNRQGVLIDAAHASRETFADLVRFSTAPIIDSHTVCAALCADFPRCLQDEELQALAAKGGVAGITFVADFLGGNGDLDQLCAHIEHAVALIGSEHVALGGDFDGATLHESCAGVQMLPNLYTRLRQRGMAEHDLNNVAGDSVRRLLLQVLPQR